jgi:protein SCO1/2
MRLPAVAFALAAVALCAGCGGSKEAAAPVFKGGLLTPAVAAPTFTLRDAAGNKHGLTQPPGHYVLVTFLYTNCPDVCPIIAGNLNLALQIDTARRAGLEVLAVSVDPENDTPAAVRRYIRQHRLVSSFHYLIGTRAELEPVWRAFHVVSSPQKGAVSHSAFEILIDPSGRERLIYDANVKPSDLIVDLAELTGDKG